jgi:hypothetical protein
MINICCKKLLIQFNYEILNRPVVLKNAAASKLKMSLLMLPKNVLRTTRTGISAWFIVEQSDVAISKM